VLAAFRYSALRGEEHFLAFLNDIRVQIRTLRTEQRCRDFGTVGAIGQRFFHLEKCLRAAGVNFDGVKVSFLVYALGKPSVIWRRRWIAICCISSGSRSSRRRISARCSSGVMPSFFPPASCAASPWRLPVHQPIKADVVFLAERRDRPIGTRSLA
jgi:hypothetical protein